MRPINEGGTVHVFGDPRRILDISSAGYRPGIIPGI